MHRRFTKVVAMAATISILFTGCASDGTMTQTGQGAAIGTLGGAALGAAIGSFSGNAGRGA
ncbi:MAG: OmpA family protein, partial [Chromatiaceae bacterium]